MGKLHKKLEQLSSSKAASPFTSPRPPDVFGGSDERGYTQSTRFTTETNGEQGWEGSVRGGTHNRVQVHPAVPGSGGKDVSTLRAEMRHFLSDNASTMPTNGQARTPHLIALSQRQRQEEREISQQLSQSQSHEHLLRGVDGAGDRRGRAGASMGEAVTNGYYAGSPSSAHAAPRESKTKSFWNSLWH